MALRSFPNRYLFSLYSKVTSLFSIRYILEIISMCKRRPFATQKMPFYKPTCNQLKICRLQSGKSTVFFCFALHHGFKFVISFYYSSWVMFCMRIRRSIHYEYCAFILRFCIDCMRTYHALRFEYHVFYVGKLCVLRLNSA